jgi:hypothetical protein
MVRTAFARRLDPLTKLAESRLDIDLRNLEHVQERGAVNRDRDAANVYGQFRKSRDANWESRDADRERRDFDKKRPECRYAHGQRGDCARESHVLVKRRVEGNRGRGDGHGEGEESGDLGELHN